MNKRFALTKIAQMAHIDTYIFSGDNIDCLYGHPDYNPICQNEEFRHMLMDKADNQIYPLIWRNDYMVYFVCLKVEQHYYMAGPIFTQVMGRAKIYKFYHDLGIEFPKESTVASHNVSQPIELTQIMASILLEREFWEDELTQANNLARDTKGSEEQEKIVFEIKQSEEELYHHSYMEERALLDCVREGRIEDALRHNQDMDLDLGRLSQKELNHWHNVAVVGITLCTRAAIEGGVTPAAAYRTSDYYIQKCDACDQMEQLIAYRNHAVEDLTRQVYEQQNKRQGSGYVARCKDYINKNYRTKLYVEDVAEALGVSKGHLSRVFKAQEGMSIMEYVTQTRLTHAANLLIYSQESIAAIAEYVNFPSQSYMGRLFKEYKGMSPAKYREKYKPREFSS